MFKSILVICTCFLFSCSQMTKKDNVAHFYELKGLEGLSGLIYEGKNSKGELVFWSHTDRGPNAKERDLNGKSGRPFLNPKFNPYWIKFSVNEKTQKFKILQKIQLPLSGLPNKEKDEVPLNRFAQTIKRDEKGIDPESMCFDGDYVWMGEEYGPSILKFNRSGKLLKRYDPAVNLPTKLQTRKLNRGFEGLTCYQGKIYAILQSPLPQDERNVLLLEFNPTTEKVEREFFYTLHNPKADKIGDLTVKNNHFYLIEQNGETGKSSIHQIYRFNLSDASINNILTSELVLDLVQKGYDFADKIEGLAILEDGRVAVVNDNDFGLTGNLNSVTGEAETDKNRKTILGIMEIKF